MGEKSHSGGKPNYDGHCSVVVVIPFLPKCAFPYTQFLLNLNKSDSTGSVISPGPTGSAGSASSAGSVGSPGSAEPGQPLPPGSTGSAASTGSAGSLPYPKDTNLAQGCVPKYLKELLDQCGYPEHTHSAVPRLYVAWLHSRAQDSVPKTRRCVVMACAKRSSA